MPAPHALWTRRRAGFVPGGLWLALWLSLTACPAARSQEFPPAEPDPFGRPGQDPARPPGAPVPAEPDPDEPAPEPAPPPSPPPDPATLRAAEAAREAARAAEEAVAEADSFRPIFNNKNLDGWKPDHAGRAFQVDPRGLLAMAPGPGWLVSAKTYGDFELFLVYRVRTAGADAGLVLRAVPEGANTTQKGYRIGLGDRDTLGVLSGVGGRAVRDPLHSAEEVKKARRPAGQWNELLVVVNGSDVVTTLNGVPVAMATIEAVRGHLGLVAEGGAVEFRTIAVRNLDAPLPVPVRDAAAEAKGAPGR